LAFWASRLETFMINRIVKKAPIKKIKNVIAAGKYSDLSSGKYKNKESTVG
jgi:hypothetical protein